MLREAIKKVKGQFLVNGGGLVVCGFLERIVFGKSQFLEKIFLKLI